MKATIYSLLDSKGILRYIGVTTQSLEKRLWQHINRAKQKKGRDYLASWIKSILGCGEVPTIEWVDEIDNWQDGYALEPAYISFYKEQGYNLVNVNPGGTGFGCKKDNPTFGKKHTIAQSAAQSKRQMGAGNPFYGRKHTPEELEKMRRGHLGLKKPGSGQRGPKSFEHIASMRVAQQARRQREKEAIC